MNQIFIVGILIFMFNLDLVLVLYQHTHSSFFLSEILNYYIQTAECSTEDSAGGGNNVEVLSFN